MMLAENELPLFERPAAANASDVPSFVWMDLHRREHIILFSVLLYMVL